jgi:hypothetical protein
VLLSAVAPVVVEWCALQHAQSLQQSAEAQLSAGVFPPEFAATLAALACSLCIWQQPPEQQSQPAACAFACDFSACALQQSALQQPPSFMLQVSCAAAADFLSPAMCILQQSGFAVVVAVALVCVAS